MLEGNTKGAILVVTYERWHTTTYIGVVSKPRDTQDSLMKKEEFINTLNNISRILDECSFTAQADAINRPIHFLSQDDLQNFEKHLNTVDIWGGSGSACEVAPFPTRQIEKEFFRQFIKLTQLMKQSGIRNKRASEVANLFQKELLRD